MKNKKSSILVAALSISFVLSSQNVLAVEDLDNQSGYVSEMDNEETSSESLFTAENRQKLTLAGFSVD